MKHWKARIYIVSQEFFKFSLLTYIVLLLAEGLKGGFISSFFNTNIFLMLILCSGVLMLITHIVEIHAEREKRKFAEDIQNCFVFAVVGAILVWYKTQDMGTISYIITFLTFVIIMLFSALLFLDEQ